MWEENGDGWCIPTILLVGTILTWDGLGGEIGMNQFWGWFRNMIPDRISWSEYIGWRHGHKNPAKMCKRSERLSDIRMICTRELVYMVCLNDFRQKGLLMPESCSDFIFSQDTLELVQQGINKLFPVMRANWPS